MEVGGQSELDRSRFIACVLGEIRCKVMPFECITQVQASISNEFFKPMSVFTEAVQLTFLSIDLEYAILPALARHPLDAQAVFVFPETCFFTYKITAPGKHLSTFILSVSVAIFMTEVVFLLKFLLLMTHSFFLFSSSLPDHGQLLAGALSVFRRN